jgi:hypothetical protein
MVLDLFVSNSIEQLVDEKKMPILLNHTMSLLVTVEQSTVWISQKFGFRRFLSQCTEFAPI